MNISDLYSIKELEALEDSYYFGKKREKKAYKEKRRWFKEYKDTLSCKGCGESHSACLDFHHRDPFKKRAGISQLLTSKTSLNVLKLEIAKCDVLCKNCHAKLHASQRSSDF